MLAVPMQRSATASKLARMGINKTQRSVQVIRAGCLFGQSA